MANTTKFALAFTYLFRPVVIEGQEEPGRQVVVFDEGGSEIANHPLQGKKFPTLVHAVREVRKQEGAGRAQGFAYSPYGAQYQRRTVKGPVPISEAIGRKGRLHPSLKTTVNA